MSDRFFEMVIKDLVGDITPQEGQELQHIMREDTASAKQYDMFRTYWAQNQTDYIDGRRLFENVQTKINELEKEAGTPVMAPLMKPVHHTGRMRWVAAAASLALLITAGGFYYIYQRGSMMQKVTAKGQKSTFIMEDGTRVTLNADSKLEYSDDFATKNREVYLTGEAFFDVHADPQKPFIIHTSKMDIKVLGTAFNVKSYPDEASSEATLIKGAIEVTVTDNPSEKIILKPSQKLVLTNFDSTRRKAVSIKDLVPNVPSVTSMTYLNDRKDSSVVMETSWLQNKLVFQDEDFGTLAKRMERYYNISIHFNRVGYRQLRFTGVLEGETIAEALNALHLTENFNYKIEDSTIVIY
ncbi:FecR domain-containing protein [Chitinophaga sancti]|uniref:FecR family protein n=1 Tax=Chitinophaga sancti TaxID=1004 RepID=UPI002A75DED1|nr:FecR domain-containing protein [Chitinophaga sancti]WPQ63117.1 FecR domain-containing protein [Chitinophaga sancti]